MSWTNELYQVYETQYGQEFHDGSVLMPISHSTANTQIEVTLRVDGTFVKARGLSKEEGKNTIIPVTEDSAARGSGVNPMPFADKLPYIAGDYSDYVEDKNADNAKYQAYMKQLQCWHESKHSHPAVNALYTYLSKKTLMHDLEKCHIVELDAETGKLTEKYKIAGVGQKEAFVRFRVNDLKEPQTWKDKTLYDAFIAWYNEQSEHIDLCYATGKYLPVAEKHPNKIRHTGDKAKLISSNDDSGFTYRGRFQNSHEALRISYDFSQKMHNALKWLIQRQGIYFDSLVMIVWASTLEPLPDIRKAGLPEEDDEDEDLYEDETPIVPDTVKGYRDVLQKRIFGNQSEIELHHKVMLLGVDAATIGRLSISFYEELGKSEFLSNLMKWHEETACRRYNRKKKKYQINSFSVYDILNCAFGTEGNLGLECKKETLKEQILRLIPCITNSRPLPADIMWALYHKASNPLAYEKSFNHHKVLETACGIIRKYNIDRKEGIIAMAYNPEETDRSYLYGCLLAIADAAERAAYDENEDKRVTNARRYWNAFSGRPYQTWKLIEERLRPYLDKLGQKSIRYEKMLNDIMAKFDFQNFEDNHALSPSYLLGYHHYTAEIYTSKKKEEE